MLVDTYASSIIMTQGSILTKLYGLNCQKIDTLISKVSKLSKEPKVKISNNNIKFDISNDTNHLSPTRLGISKIQNIPNNLKIQLEHNEEDDFVDVLPQSNRNNCLRKKDSIKLEGSCFSFKENNKGGNYSFKVNFNTKKTWKDSVNSDCEKRRAEVNKIACFITPTELKPIRLLIDTKGLLKTSSMKVWRRYKDFNDISNVSNKSTCSLSSSILESNSVDDDSFFYKETKQRTTDYTEIKDTRLDHSIRLEKGKSSRLNKSKESSETESREHIFDHMSKWIPDDFSKRCMTCKRKFDFFTRKHHCRKCGQLLCFDCCSQWVKIKDLVKSDLWKHPKVNFKIILIYRPWKKLQKSSKIWM